MRFRRFVTMSKLLLLVLVAIGATQALPTTNTKDLHPDAGLPLEELVEKYGYPFEVHEDVQTDDGYLLTIHRIPHGKNNADQQNKPVALLMHCLMCSSAIYITYGPEKGLAFILADLGYDVWMPNARGTTFSKKHITLDPKEDAPEFWKFSWHQIGYYDVPASMDYITEQTGQEKMFYVGYSQGTTSFYVMASERPEYNDRIILSVSLAPIGYMSNMENDFLQFISQYVNELDFLLGLIGWYEFVPNLDFMGALTEYCRNAGKELCDNIFFFLFGQDSTQMEENMLPVFATHLPAGASSKQFVHYGQEIISGYFRRFDHGLVGNLAEYGTVTPPNYDTSKITAPMALFYSENDSNAAIIDVMQLVDELPNVVHMQLIEDPTFTHVDFVFSVNVVELVYEHVTEVMSHYL